MSRSVRCPVKLWLAARRLRDNDDQMAAQIGDAVVDNAVFEVTDVV